MKLRIKSDGTAVGTRVFAVSEDGAETEISGVKAVSWHAEAGKICLAILEVDGVEVEVDGEHAIPARAAHRGPLDDMGKADDIDPGSLIDELRGLYPDGHPHAERPLTGPMTAGGFDRGFGSR